MHLFTRSCVMMRLTLPGVLGLALCVSALAHDPGLSSANLEIAHGAVNLQLTYNERDIAGLVGATVDELKSGSVEARAKLDVAARRAVLLRFEGQPQTPNSIATSTDQNSNVELRYTFTSPAAIAEIGFESALLKEMAFGHRQAFAAFDFSGREIARSILSGRESGTTFSLGNSATQQTPDSKSRFSAFFLLGVHHIVTGYDHLLFLLGLLIVCRTPRSALLLITCFTVAHSFTLALSTFGLVDLPGRLVEAIIAASILYVGIENVVRRDGILRGRWLLTFVFGLIHGLSFAGVLHEMGIAKQGLGAAVPLVAFNSGVEAGQLAIAAVVLPIIWQLRRRPGFLRVGVPACSALVAVAGAYWLLERTVWS